MNKLGNKSEGRLTDNFYKPPVRPAYSEKSEDTRVSGKTGTAGLKIAAVYASVVLGAGFASGQELLQYFVVYGTSGLWGLILSGVLFAVTGWATLDICRQNRISGYAPLMTHLMGKRIGFVTELLTAVFLFALFAAMLAAGGATVAQSSDISFTAGVFIIAAICLFVLLFELKGFVLINSLFTPLMVIGGVFFGLFTLFNHTVSASFQNTVVPGWVLSSIVYSAYNIVTAISVLSAVSSMSRKKSDCATGGLLGGAVLTLLGLCMALPLYLYYSDVISVEIPFLVIVVGYGRLFSYMYLGLMLCAIVTTAISNAFAFIEWSKAYIKINRRVLCAAFVALGIPAAYLGFSNFVGIVYPLFGLLGVFQIIVIILSWLRRP